MINMEEKSDLVGADDEYNVVKISWAANVMLHLVKPRVKCIEAGSVCYVVHQQGTLCVGVELVTNLTQSTASTTDFS